MNQYLITRRRFLRNTTIATAGIVATSGLGFNIFAESVRGVSIIVDPADFIENYAKIHQLNMSIK